MAKRTKGHRPAKSAVLESCDALIDGLREAESESEVLEALANLAW